MSERSPVILVIERVEFPIDRVSGYTIQQLEQALVGARAWGEWKDHIREMYNNPTEQFLDELFANWDR